MNYSKEVMKQITKARANARKRLVTAHPEEYTRYLQSEYDRMGLDITAHRPRGTGKARQKREAAQLRRELRRAKRIEALKQELAALES